MHTLSLKNNYQIALLPYEYYSCTRFLLLFLLCFFLFLFFLFFLFFYFLHCYLLSFNTSVLSFLLPSVSLDRREIFSTERKTLGILTQLYCSLYTSLTLLPRAVSITKEHIYYMLLRLTLRTRDIETGVFSCFVNKFLLDFYHCSKNLVFKISFLLFTF